VAAVAECPNVVCKVGGIQMVPPPPLPKPGIHRVRAT
jgi:hypothetical protein